MSKRYVLIEAEEDESNRELEYVTLLSVTHDCSTLFTSHSQSRSTLPSWSNQQTTQIRSIWLIICLMLHNNVRLKLDTSQLLKLYSKSSFNFANARFPVGHFPVIACNYLKTWLSHWHTRGLYIDGYSFWQIAMLRKKTPMLTLRGTGSWSPKFLAQRTHTGTEAMAIEVQL